MDNDIVVRLRNNKHGESYTWKTISEAADEIERLRQQNEELRKVNSFLNHKLSDAIKEINPLIIAKATGGE